MFSSGKNYPTRKSWQKNHPSDTNYPKLGFVVHAQRGGNFQGTLNIGRRVGNDDQRRYDLRRTFLNESFLKLILSREVRYKLEDQAEEIWERVGERDQAAEQSHHVPSPWCDDPKGEATGSAKGVLSLFCSGLLGTRAALAGRCNTFRQQNVAAL